MKNDKDNVFYLTENIYNLSKVQAKHCYFPPFQNIYQPSLLLRDHSSFWGMSEVKVRQRINEVSYSFLG